MEIHKFWKLQDKYTGLWQIFIQLVYGKTVTTLTVDMQKVEKLNSEIIQNIDNVYY